MGARTARAAKYHDGCIDPGCIAGATRRIEYLMVTITISEVAHHHVQAVLVRTIGMRVFKRYTSERLLVKPAWTFLE